MKPEVDDRESLKDFQDRLARLGGQSVPAPLPDTEYVRNYLKKVSDSTEPAPVVLTAEDLWKVFLKRIKLTLERTGKKIRLDEGRDKIYKSLCMYFTGDPRFETCGEDFLLTKGIMIRGPYGVGKSISLRCFCNHYSWNDGIKIPESFPMGNIVSCKTIERQYGESGYVTLNKFTKYNHLTDPSQMQFVFDDVGSESISTGHFGNKINVIETLIMERYDMFINYGLKTFMTTNLMNGNEIEDKYGPRVRSRIREMFNVIDWDGTDLR